MSQQSDDKPLVDFLQQYRSVPPAAPPDLEERIFKAIESAPPAQLKGRNCWRKNLWLVPPAIAAALLAAWGSDRLTSPPSPSPAQLANLEAFLETSWDGAVGNSQAADAPIEWFSPANSTEPSND